MISTRSTRSRVSKSRGVRVHSFTRLQFQGYRGTLLVGKNDGSTKRRWFQYHSIQATDWTKQSNGCKWFSSRAHDHVNHNNCYPHRVGHKHACLYACSCCPWNCWIESLSQNFSTGNLVECAWARRLVNARPHHLLTNILIRKFNVLV